MLMAIISAIGILVSASITLTQTIGDSRYTSEVNSIVNKANDLKDEIRKRNVVHQQDIVKYQNLANQIQSRLGQISPKYAFMLEKQLKDANEKVKKAVGQSQEDMNDIDRVNSVGQNLPQGLSNVFDNNIETGNSKTYDTISQQFDDMSRKYLGNGG